MLRSIHVVYPILKDFVDELYKIVFVLIEHSIVNRSLHLYLSSLLINDFVSFRLSISTIEEHTSAVSSPVRKSVKAPEKECGIQCNVSD